MKHFQRHHFWTTGIVALVLLSFFAGTSLACFQKGTGNIKKAEDCCQSYCQHAMMGEAATDCCKQHQVGAAPSIPAATPSKVLFLTTFAYLAPVIFSLEQEGQGWQVSPVERPRPCPPLYTLHCAFLI